MVDNGEWIARRIVHSIAEHTDTDPLELPPLYDTIDPEMVETGLETIQDGTISFEYVGHTVTVGTDGAVTISEAPTNSSGQAEPTTTD